MGSKGSQIRYNFHPKLILGIGIEHSIFNIEAVEERSYELGSPECSGERDRTVVPSRSRNRTSLTPSTLAAESCSRRRKDANSSLEQLKKEILAEGTTSPGSCLYSSVLL